MDFGETTIHGDDQADNEVCYTGGIYDQTTGLYYLNARYYDPEEGRFLTEVHIVEKMINLIHSVYTYTVRIIR